MIDNTRRLKSSEERWRMGPYELAECQRLAAADLYDALKAITDCYGVGYKSVDRFVEDVHDLMMEGRAALAKARGEKL